MSFLSCLKSYGHDNTLFTDFSPGQLYSVLSIADKLLKESTPSYKFRLVNDVYEAAVELSKCTMAMDMAFVGIISHDKTCHAVGVYLSAENGESYVSSFVDIERSKTQVVQSTFTEAFTSHGGSELESDDGFEPLEIPTQTDSEEDGFVLVQREAANKSFNKIANMNLELNSSELDESFIIPLKEESVSGLPRRKVELTIYDSLVKGILSPVKYESLFSMYRTLFSECGITVSKCEVVNINVQGALQTNCGRYAPISCIAKACGYNPRQLGTLYSDLAIKCHTIEKISKDPALGDKDAMPSRSNRILNN